MVDGLELDTVDAVKDEENDEIIFTGEVTNLDLDQVQGARCWIQFNTREGCLMPTQEFTAIGEEGQFDLTETVILEDAEYFFKVKAEAINIFEDYDVRRAEKFELNAGDFTTVIESEQFMDDNTESEEVDKWFNTGIARNVFYSADNWVNKGIYNRSQNADEDVLVDSDWTATSRDFDFITGDNTLMEEMTDSEQSMNDATSSETAMDKVTDKEMNSEKIGSKTMARTIFFKSEFLNQFFWDKNNSLTAFYENNNLLETWQDANDSSETFVENDYVVARAWADGGMTEDEPAAGIEKEIDFDRVNEIEYNIEVEEDNGTTFMIEVGNDQILFDSSGRNDSGTVDVSGKSGNQDLVVAVSTSFSSTSDWAEIHITELSFN